MKQFPFLVALLFLSSFFQGFTQTDGVIIDYDGQTREPSAILEVFSTTQGFLAPRLTLAQRNAITNPATSLLIFQTDNNPGYYYNLGTPATPQWERFLDPSITIAGNTLDAAYDQGGAGLGREINATDGAMRINGDDGFLVTGTLGSGDAIEVSGAGTRMFFNPRKAAFRAGLVNATQWDDANVGSYSTAIGRNTKASGVCSIAMGQSTNASGGSSTAIGQGARALGTYSTAMGRYTTAASFNETAVGSYTTTYTLASATSWDLSDRLFVVGNGTSTTSRSNALTIYKDGKMNINDAYDMPMADGVAGQVMTTDGAGVVSFVDPNTLIPTPSLDGAYDQGGAGLGREIDATDGAVRINGDDGFLVTGTVGSGDAIEVSGAGARMFYNPKKAAFRAGRVLADQWDDANVGNYSTALGASTTASGDFSTALGANTTASGARATAMGSNTVASGDYSTAIGFAPTASGYNSTAMGRSTTASGNYSTAMGSNTTAPSFVETAIGRYTTTYTPASVTGWNAADRLFVIGNGTGTSARSDAMVVLKNGNTGFGTSTPTSNVHIKNTGDASIWIEADADNVTEYDNPYLKMTQDGNSVSGIIGLSAVDNVNPASASYAAYTGLLGNALVIGTETANDLQFGTENQVRMTIAKTTGRVGIGTNAPTSDLHIKQSEDPVTSLVNPTTGGITLEDRNGEYEWQIWNSYPFLSFAFNNVSVSRVNWSTGAWMVVSDRRVKKDIEPMEDVLSKVMQLNTVKYRYNHNADDAIKTRGFIAQEVQEVFPDLVYTEDGDRLGIAPSDFGILSIKAIQEQQAQIEAQQQVNEQQQALIEQLLQRIEQLENR